MKIGNVEVYGIIYKITNKVNGKVYIGQTRKGFDKRYGCRGSKIERVYNYHNMRKRGKREKYNRHLLGSIEKYGFEAFEVIEIFDIAFSKKELNVKEKCYISIFDSFHNGYNYALGGDGREGCPHTEEHKQYMSNLYMGENNPFYGKQHSKELRTEISKRTKGKNNPNAKSVICLTTKRIFHMAKDAAEFYGIKDKFSIGQVCRGKRKTCGRLSDGTPLTWKYIIWKHNKKYRIKRGG